MTKVSASEFARRAGKKEAAIRAAIREGRLLAERNPSGRGWLIDVERGLTQLVENTHPISGWHGQSRNWAKSRDREDSRGIDGAAVAGALVAIENAAAARIRAAGAAIMKVVEKPEGDVARKIAVELEMALYRIGGDVSGAAKSLFGRSVFIWVCSPTPFHSDLSKKEETDARDEIENDDELLEVYGVEPCPK